MTDRHITDSPHSESHAAGHGPNGADEATGGHSDELQIDTEHAAEVETHVPRVAREGAAGSKATSSGIGFEPLNVAKSHRSVSSAPANRFLTAF
jgi:hypothetical protein